MRMLFAAIAFSALAACATVGKPVDMGAIQGFTPGTTTIAQAESVLGAPTTTTKAPDGSTYLTYSYAHAQSYIVGGHANSQFAQLVFGPDGTFVHAITSNGQTATHAGD